VGVDGRARAPQNPPAAAGLPQADRALRAGVGEVLLEVRDLRTHFDVMDGVVKAVDGVSFSIRRGGRLALVGESGCGKSVTALSIMRLIETPPGRFAGGQILFDGRDLLTLEDPEIRRIRGGAIAMIFQEPMTSLNPVLTIGEQLGEAITLHQRVDRRRARDIAAGTLDDVGVADPRRRLQQYPHELSGGMRQRVMIAMALSCRPALIIADEPTTALDVTIQRQILELIKDVQARTGAALLLISHDLGVVAETVDDVAVMYAGRVVETGTVDEVLLQPRHPYTRGLLGSIPSRGRRGQPLAVIAGVVPNPFRMPPGCTFQPRCPYAWDDCLGAEPDLIDLGPGRSARCILHLPRHAARLATYDSPVPLAAAAHRFAPAGGATRRRS
jgi:oligopeptide/dipeptide ABC transporter ATP-binding protein